MMSIKKFSCLVFHLFFQHAHCKKNHSQFTQITNTASKIIGLHTPNLQKLNIKAITRMAHAISLDTTHPLNRYFSILPSGRKYRSIQCNKTHFSRSLIPSTIPLLNQAEPHWKCV